MSAAKFFRHAIFSLAVILLSASGALANIYPPKPSAHFYGDATGDTGVTGTDLIQHYNYILSKAYTYDTLQPNNPAQAWNTCDVDSNRGCTGTDTIVMNSYILSKSVSIADDPWSVNNINLTLTGNSPSTWIPFNIDLHSTFTALPSGRSGVSVVVEIDPILSTGTGQLSGRECNPVAGTRDQLTAANAQCALAVTVTDWPTSAGTGPTESGVYGLQVMGDGNGTLNLKVYTVAVPGLDIPATSIRLPLDIGIVPPMASIDCSNPGPNPVNEGQLIQCAVTGNFGTPVIDGGVDTCGGSLAGGIYSYTPGEGGARTCVAAVINDTATDSDTVTINDVNLQPTIAVTCPGNVIEPAPINCTIVVADGDVPADTLTCSLGAGDTCGGTLTACTNYDLANSAGKSPSCVVEVMVDDNAGQPNSTAYDSPVVWFPDDFISLNCPASADEDASFSCTFNSGGGSPCAIGAGTTCTGVTITDCTQIDIAAQGEAAGPGSCLVQVVKGTASDTESANILEVNQNPVITSTCPSTAPESGCGGGTYTCNLTATDADLPTQTLTWATTASDTCGGTITGSTYSYSPSESQGGGTCVVGIRVADNWTPTPGTASQNTTVNVTETNCNPVITSTCSGSASEGTAYSCSLTATDADIPAQSLTWSKAASDTCGGTASGSTYNWTPSENQGGTQCVVGVQVADSFAPPGTATQNTTVTVIEDCHQPIITSICSSNASEGIAYSCSLSASDGEIPIRPMTWVVLPGDTCGGFVIGSQYNWTPIETQGGSNCMLSVQVSNGCATANYNVTVSVAETNLNPVITSTCSGTASEGLLYSCNLTATDADLPVQTLTWSKLGTDTCGGTIDSSTYSWTPTEMQGGTNCTLAVRVADNFSTPGTADYSRTVNVIEEECYPIITSTCSTSASEGIAYTCSLTATDCDLPAQPLTWTKMAADTCGGDIVGTTYMWTPSETQGGTQCVVGVQVADNYMPPGTATQNTTVTVIETNVNPVITSTCSPDACLAMLYTCNLSAVDADLPAQTLTWSKTASDTCGGTVSGTTYTWTPYTPTSCVIGIQVADNFTPAGTATQSTTENVVSCDGPWLTGVSVSSTLGGIDPAIARIKNNYPADWNQFTINFNASPGATCSATVNCGSAVTVTGAPSGNNCVVTATAGYWPSTATCTISAITTAASCTNCGTYTNQTFATSLRTSECATRGGTCGGFIDNGTYGTGDGLNIYLIDMKSITGGYVIPPASTYVYVLTEHPAQVPPTRIEAFDANRDGLVTITSANGLRTEAAKISAGYKNVTGTCAYEPAFGINENLLCYRYVTMADIDARRVNLPMELTTVGDWDQPEAQLWGYIPIAGFISYVGTTPAGNTFPNPVRAGFAILGLIDQGMSSINLDELLRPTGQNSTLSLCFQELGLNVGGIALPGNLMLPDLVRQDWNAACSNNWKMSPANTTFRIYTNRGNMTRKVIAMGASVVSTLFDLYKSLDITQLPITMTALGTDTIVIPALTVDINMGSNGGVWASGYTTPKSVPFEFDYRVASSYPVRLHVANPPYDPARVALGVAATPDYGDPNRNGTANHSGQMYIFGENLLLTGVRAGASGLIPFQLVMTPMIDDNVFTVFQRHNTAAKTFGDQEPWGVGGTSRVVSATMRGLPSTTTDADITWSSATLGLVGIMMRGFAESVAASGAASGQIDVPGSSSNSNMVGVLESYNNQIIGAASWLPLPTLTSPANNGYFVPPQADVRTWPINRNGQLIRGTATIAGHPIQIAAGARYFTLSNPGVDGGTTRRADLYYMDLKDTRHIATNYNDPVRDYPVNTLWRMYGNINAQASLTVTLPFIAPRRVTLSGVYGMVPDPWEAGNFVNLSMDWALTELIIDSGVRGMNRKWDYQNFSIVYLYENSYLSAGESHQFIWK